jgi:RNA polymerase sigma-70 factor, ECF subfamily
VEVFWRLWQNPRVNAPNVGTWLYRTAMRMSLDELRMRSRREKYEVFFNLFRAVPRPDQVHEANEERQRICAVLATMKIRDAELLMLWTEGQTYEEIAEIAGMNPASVGTLLSRAQQAFRKEYIKRYGNA